MKTTNRRWAKPGETHRYPIMIQGTKTGYCADVPDLPGCIAAAKSLKKVLQLIAEGIEMHMEGMQDQGEPIPVPRRSIEFTVDPDDQEAFCTWVEVKVPTVATSPR